MASFSGGQGPTRRKWFSTENVSSPEIDQQVYRAIYYFFFYFQFTPNFILGQKQFAKGTVQRLLLIKVQYKMIRLKSKLFSETINVNNTSKESILYLYFISKPHLLIFEQDLLFRIADVGVAFEKPAYPITDAMSISLFIYCINSLKK